MNDLAERFTDVIDELEVPDVDLVDRVIDDLRSPVDLTTERLRRTRWANRTVVAGAAAVLLVLALVIVEPARQAVADFFGIGAVRIERGEPGPNPTHEPTALSEATNRSEPTARSEPNPVPGQAGELAPDAINPIQSLGRPTVIDGDAARRRTYRWTGLATGGRSDVTLEVRLVEGPLEFKQLGGDPDSEFLSVEVHGGAGEVSALWIPNVHQRVITEGQPAVTAGPTLIWVSDNIQYRLEGPTERNAAVAFAEEVTGGTELLAAG